MDSAARKSRVNFPNFHPILRASGNALRITIRPDEDRLLRGRLLRLIHQLNQRLIRTLRIHRAACDSEHITNPSEVGFPSIGRQARGRQRLKLAAEEDQS